VRIILVDPAENATSEVANFVLNNQPGSDEALIRGLLYGVINLGFSKDGGSPIGVEAIAQSAQISGIGTDTLLMVCRELGQAEKPVIIIGKGVTRSSGSTLVALEDLAHVTGAVLVNVNGKANTLAAQSYQLDKVFDPGNHEVVYVALGDDYLTPRLTENLNKSSYLVLQTSYENALMDSADVVLPVEMWAEQAGHFLNLEGRLQESKRVLAPAAAVRSNLAVFQNLAGLLGVDLDENWKESLQERVHA
jgi:formate dehydrogenase major subunit